MVNVDTRKKMQVECFRADMIPQLTYINNESDQYPTDSFKAAGDQGTSNEAEGRTEGLRLWHKSTDKDLEPTLDDDRRTPELR